MTKKPIYSQFDPATKCCPNCYRIVGNATRRCPACDHAFAIAGPKLKGCPFCGERGVYGRGGYPWLGYERMYTAGCPHGHAESPEMDTKTEAAAWWNRRASSRRKRNDAD